MQTNFNSIAKVEHSHYEEECVAVIYVALEFSINTESICKSTTKKLLPAKTLKSPSLKPLSSLGDIPNACACSACHGLPLAIQVPDGVDAFAAHDGERVMREGVEKETLDCEAEERWS